MAFNFWRKVLGGFGPNKKGENTTPTVPETENTGPRTHPPIKMNYPETIETTEHHPTNSPPPEGDGIHPHIQTPQTPTENKG